MLPTLVGWYNLHTLLVYINQVEVYDAIRWDVMNSNISK
jgi:hypothetical protein